MFIRTLCCLCQSLRLVLYCLIKLITEWVTLSNLEKIIDEINDSPDLIASIGGLLDNIENCTDSNLIIFLYALKEIIKQFEFELTAEMTGYVIKIICLRIKSHMQDKDVIYECLNILINLTFRVKWTELFDFSDFKLFDIIVERYSNDIDIIYEYIWMTFHLICDGFEAFRLVLEHTNFAQNLMTWIKSNQITIEITVYYAKIMYAVCSYISLIMDQKVDGTFTMSDGASERNSFEYNSHSDNQRHTDNQISENELSKILSIKVDYNNLIEENWKILVNLTSLKTVDLKIVDLWISSISHILQYYNEPKFQIYKMIVNEDLYCALNDLLWLDDKMINTRCLEILALIDICDLIDNPDWFNILNLKRICSDEYWGICNVISKAATDLTRIEFKNFVSSGICTWLPAYLGSSDLELRIDALETIETIFEHYYADLFDDNIVYMLIEMCKSTWDLSTLTRVLSKWLTKRIFRGLQISIGVILLKMSLFYHSNFCYDA